MRMSVPKLKYFYLLFAFLLTSCFWDGTDDNADFLPLNDSEYPYAGLPRVVIEVEDFGGIRDVESELKARLQIYGDSVPESDVYKLTVRGRGNSSAKMPKYGLKLEFEDKVKMFGMPKNKDWALIANFGEKTHLRNYMMSRLSEWLGAKWTPKMQFVELYLNRKYMGLYLFAETVKVSKNRVNIDKHSFLLEKETNDKLDPPYVVTNGGHPFHIKYPKDLNDSVTANLLDRLNVFENFIYNENLDNSAELSGKLDVDEFLLYYWVQEFSKNEDGAFGRSIFMTLDSNDVFHFGPLWDFDLAFGNASRENVKPAENWFVRSYGWNYHIFKSPYVRNSAKEYWQKNRDLFVDLIDSVPVYRKVIERAIKNEYKRWPVMGNTENWALKEPYDSYDEAVEDMVLWMKKRCQWIDAQYEN